MKIQTGSPSGTKSLFWYILLQTGSPSGTATQIFQIGTQFGRFIDMKMCLGEMWKDRVFASFD